MSWIIFALIAPFFWAISNFVDKHLLGKHTKGIYDFLFLSSASSLIFGLVLLLFFDFPVFSIYWLIPITTGFFLILSYGFYAHALEKGDTSSLVVLFQLIPVVTLVSGFIFLGQTISSSEFLAFLIVLLGGGHRFVSKRRGKNICKGIYSNSCFYFDVGNYHAFGRFWS